MRETNFEHTLPPHYRQVYHLDAKNKKVGILFNLIALAVMLVILGLASIPMIALGTSLWEFSPGEILLFPLLLILSMLAYMVLHELVHGIAYQLCTGQRLTFGVSWSCAFCGVPQIYTYRKIALIAVLAPFVIFGILLTALCAVAFFVHPLFYLGAVILLGLHMGGCCGDLYVSILLLFKYRDPKTLMRDTGPEQFFYISE